MVQWASAGDWKATPQTTGTLLQCACLLAAWVEGRGERCTIIISFSYAIRKSNACSQRSLVLINMVYYYNSMYLCTHCSHTVHKIHGHCHYIQYVDTFSKECKKLGGDSLDSLFEYLSAILKWRWNSVVLVIIFGHITAAYQCKTIESQLAVLLCICGPLFSYGLCNLWNSKQMW